MLVPLAQAADPSAGSPNFATILIWIGSFFILFYFLVMRPQGRQQKEHKGFLDKLGKGDEVVTASGIIGRVSSVTGDVVQVEVANNVRLRVLKNQIQGPYKPAEVAAEKVADKPAEEAAKK